MNIDVLIASRGHPKELETSVRVMIALESGLHNIRYIIGMDEDDQKTIALTNEALRNTNTIILPAPRPTCFGSVWNRCATFSTAEYLMIMGDGPLCLTQSWDNWLPQLMNKDLMFSGLWAYAPSLACFPVITRQWYEATQTIMTEPLTISTSQGRLMFISG